MKTLPRPLRLLLLLALAIALSSCLFSGTLEVRVFENIVSIFVGDPELGSRVSLGACFEEPEEGIYHCDIRGVTSSFEVLTFPELLVTLVLLDPLVLQVPDELTNFNGFYRHFDSGTGGALVISSGLDSLPIDVDRTLVADPGTQFVIIALPEGSPMTGDFSFRLSFQVPPGTTAIEVKPIITGLVELTDGSRFYPPILPCVDDMANAPAMTLPVSAPGGSVSLPSVPPDLACDNVTYNFIPRDEPPTDDADGDGVPDGADLCTGTVLPESVPTRTLRVNHFALVDQDGHFDTVRPGGTGPGRSFTIEETGGCSCEQIITELELGEGHRQFGCSISAMEEWIARVSP